MPKMWRALSLTLFLVALSLPKPAAGQEKQGPRGVRDEAKLFSQEFVDKANAIATQIKEKHGKDLLVETVNEIPNDVKDRFAWAQGRVKKAGADGVYLVISNKPKVFEVVVSAKTLEAGLFQKKNVDELLSLIKKNLKESRDVTLVKVADYTLETMNSQAKSKKVNK